MTPMLLRDRGTSEPIPRDGSPLLGPVVGVLHVDRQSMERPLLTTDSV